ncbi:MAG: PorT family protein [Saprospiraceae bacterium]|nr:PorT family protein [Saprospiraceae bacterium]
MKNLLKSLFAVMMFVCLQNAAQAQFLFGIQGGYNGAVVRSKILDKESTSDLLSAFNVGAVIDYRFSELLGLHSGLLFSQKGGVDDGSTLRVNYLQLPLHLALNLDLGGIIPYVSAGGYAAYAISGTYKDSAGSEDLAFGEKGLDGDDLSPLDFGIGVGAGIKFEMGLELGLTYDLGLKNIVPNDVASDDFINGNSVIGIHAGYYFNR